MDDLTQPDGTTPETTAPAAGPAPRRTSRVRRVVAALALGVALGGVGVAVVPDAPAERATSVEALFGGAWT